MTKLRMFAVTVLAAATVGVGALVATPSASAATNLTCNQAFALSVHYSILSVDAYGAGSTFWGRFYEALASIYGGYC
jgi:hypothetical protein